MEAFVRQEEENGLVTFRLVSWQQRDPKLSAGFSSRVGGVSRGRWDSLNCALHVEDDPEHVLENRRRLAAAAGFDYAAWTCAEQVHGKRVAAVRTADRGRGRGSRDTAIPEADALITDEPGIMLVSFYADCVPIYYYDPEVRAAGLAHAGWRGTAKRIAGEAVQAMRKTYGSKPENLYAAIGPSIGPCCYEVDERVIEAMEAAGLTAGWTEQDNGRYMLNLQELNRQILIQEGILPINIEISTRCTSCHADDFFSHRRDGPTGRMASWIGWKR